MALALGESDPAVVAVNPASMPGSKMVKEAFGVDGGDLGIGADILTRAALDDQVATATGKYFDNDAKRFAPPHPDAMVAQKTAALIPAMDAVLKRAIA